jgi:hypothetical protein
MGIEATAETLGGPEIGTQLSADELGAITQARTAEALEGGTLGKAGAIGRGLLAAGTAGLSEGAFFGAETELEKEREALRRQAVGEYQAGAEIFGDVALAIASGGTSTLARGAGLTAPGLIARGGRRLAGEAPGVLRSSLAGAAEGAASAIAQSFGYAALSDEPMSASSIASGVGLGALLGGGGGLVAGGLGRARGKLSALDVESAAARGADDFAQVLQRGEDAALGRVAGELGEKAAKNSKNVKLSTLFSKRGKAPEMTRGAASELLGGIQARTGRAAAARTALDDIAAAAQGAGQKLDDDLVARARLVLDDYEVAVERAVSASPAIADDAAQAAAGAAVKAPREAVDAMRGLDRADRDIAAVFADLKSTVAPVAQATSATPAGGMLARGLDTIGGLELGGISVLSGLPGIGPLLGGLAKVRALGNTFASIRNTPAVQAARGAARNSDRLTTITSRAARAARSLDNLPGVRRGMARAATMAPAQVARLWRDARSVAGTDTAAAIAAAAPDLPDDVRAQAVKLLGDKLSYLQEQLPSPPPGLEYVGSQWQPTKAEATRFGEIHATLDDPFGAVGDVMAGRARFGQSVVDAIRSVYPAVYQEVQASLVANAAQIIGSRPRAVVAEWSRLWSVPLLPESQPSYRMPPTPGAPEAAGPVQRPPSAVSAVAMGAELDRPGHG